MNKKIIFVSYGDSRSAVSWSNIPYLFSENLEKKGFELVRLDINPNPETNLWWGNYVYRYLSILFPNHYYSYIRTWFFRRETFQKIKKIVRENPDAYFCIFLNFEFYNKFSKVPSLLFGDWTYDIVILDRLNRKPYFFEKFIMKFGVQDFEAFYLYLKIGFIALAFIAIIILFIYKREKLIEFAKGIFHGLTTIFKLKQKVKFILLSIAIWVSYYFAAYLVCFALPETSHFTFADGFFVIVVGTLGMMVPASGGIGAFHFAMKIGIGALFFSYGKTFEEGAAIGLSYAFISHTMQLVIMAVMGVISIPMLAKARNEAVKSKVFSE